MFQPSTSSQMMGTERTSFTEQAQHVDAKEFLQDAIRRGKVRASSETVAGALEGLAGALANQQNFAKAEHCLRRALAILKYRSGEVEHHEGRLLFGISGLLILQQKKGQAQRTFRQAIAAARSTGYPRGRELELTLLQIAKLWNDCGDLDLAHDVYKEAMNVRRTKLIGHLKTE